MTRKSLKDRSDGYKQWENKWHESTWVRSKLRAKVKRNKDDAMNQHAWEDEPKDERRWIEVKDKDVVAVRGERKGTSIVYEASWVESVKS